MTNQRMIMKRYGGSSQLRIDSVQELKSVIDLPEVHWAVLSCPVKGLHCDERFLSLIDEDQDGRIGTSELKQNIIWTLERLQESCDLRQDSTELQLSDLTPAADYLKQSALMILKNLGDEQQERISLEQIRRRDAILKNAGANGDGVVTINSINDETLRRAAADIAKVIPLVDEQQERKGLDASCLEQFSKQRDAALELYQQGNAHFFWGDQTETIATTILQINQEIQNWFALQDLCTMNPQLGQQFIERQHTPPQAGDRPAIDQAIDAQLIADPQQPLTWDAITTTPSGRLLLSLKEVCFAGDKELTLEVWQSALARAQDWQAWQNDSQSNKAFTLGRERLQEIDEPMLQGLQDICDADAALAEDINNIDALERLILSKRWIFAFTNNFVSLPYLFDRNARAMFEQGTLIMRGRQFNLAVLVYDRKQHIQLASESGMCVCYIEISGDQPPRKFEVAVPITAGTRQGLFVGRRGVFFDINKRRLEAKIVHIIDNPVSIKEAVFQPFTRIGRFFSSKIEAWSASADKKFESQVADVVADKDLPAKTEAGPAPAGVGTVLMGGSVAFAALGSSLAFITKQLSEIAPHKILLGLAIIMLLIMVPTAVLAFMKLRRRNLAALLQASDWAVNEPMMLSYSLARLLCNRPALPAHAISETRDEIENILKNCDIEDDRAVHYQAWSVTFTLLAGSLAIADLFLATNTHVLWMAITASVSALLACYFGLRSWRRNILLLTLLFLMLTGCLTWLCLSWQA